MLFHKEYFSQTNAQPDIFANKDIGLYLLNV